MFKSRNQILKVFYIVVAFILTCTLLVFNTDEIEQYNLVVGGVAPVKIKSPIQTINEYQTELLRQEAEKNTPSIYVTDTEITNGVLENLNSFFEKVEEQRSAYSFMVDYNEMIPEGETARTFNYENVIDGYQVAEVETLLTMSEVEYDTFKNAIITVTEGTLTDGVKADEMSKTSVIIRDGLSTKMDAKYVDLAYKVVLDFIEPNTFIDQESTNAAIEVAKENVNSIVIQEGQTIVDEGEIITLSSYKLLEQLGFIEEETSGVDFSLILSYCSLVLILFAMILGYIYKCNLKVFARSNILSAYFAIYILCISLLSVLDGNAYAPSICILCGFWTAVLIDFRLAFITNIVLAFLGITLADFTLVSVLYVIVTGTFMVSFSHYIADRTRIISVTIILCLFNLLLFYTLSYFYGMDILKHEVIESEYLTTLTTPILSTILVVLIAFGSMPLWEGFFGILTPTTLIELTKPTKPLLRRLTIEAPGTYHHSLIVANLAEEAAVKVGANPHITRVACYYHDIGKLVNPNYFAENQDGVSMHQYLSPIESANIIKSHITEGITLAKKYKLPKQIIDVAYQHHGNTLVKYFYFKALEQDETASEDDFRYIGDRPKTKEAGIIMLADTVEAAVRSVIKDVTSKEELKAFIDKLINGKILDGQLDECELTYHEVSLIKETFLNVFKGMYHERVVYPEDKKEEEKEELHYTEKNSQTNENTNEDTNVSDNFSNEDEEKVNGDK
ncbi:MAG: HD family phosphohydrolase [Lachnospirales bacterium]